MKVAIFGSRTIDDYELVKKAIESEGLDITLILSGGARGVDQLGERYAAEHGIPVEQHLPNWRLYGKSAGFRRNRDMARACDEAIGIVQIANGKFSAGSRHMAECVDGYGKNCHIYPVLVEEAAPPSPLFETPSEAASDAA